MHYRSYYNAITTFLHQLPTALEYIFSSVQVNFCTFKPCVLKTIQMYFVEIYYYVKKKSSIRASASIQGRNLGMQVSMQYAFLQEMLSYVIFIHIYLLLSKMRPSVRPCDKFINQNIQGNLQTKNTQTSFKYPNNTFLKGLNHVSSWSAWESPRSKIVFKFASKDTKTRVVNSLLSYWPFKIK